MIRSVWRVGRLHVLARCAFWEGPKSRRQRAVVQVDAHVTLHRDMVTSVAGISWQLVAVEVDVDRVVLCQADINASYHHLTVLESNQLVHLPGLESLTKCLSRHLAEVGTKVVVMRVKKVDSLRLKTASWRAPLYFVLGQTRKLHYLFFLCTNELQLLDMDILNLFAKVCQCTLLRLS